MRAGSDQPLPLTQPLLATVSAKTSYVMGPPLSSSSSSSGPSYHKAVAFNVGIPLCVFAVLAAFYSSYVVMGYNWVWFSWHPSSMLVSYVAMAGNAFLIKKIGGYDNTKKHGVLMVVATVVASFAFYVILSNKNSQKKAHFTTLHGKLGLAVVLSYLGLGLVGAVGLNPDWGYFKLNKQVRAIHKYSGRVITLMAWACCVLGYQTMDKDVLHQAVFAIPLVVFSYYTML